jgi:uncharacterized membrane protein YdcZ (DUF606 family)
VKSALIAIIEYLLGFFALAVFAAYAFGQGASPSDARMITAFKLGACLAVVELIILARRAKPANRLIVGANLWLLIGGLAAFFQVWWVLQGYQRFGEASLFVAILLVGIVSTLALPGGFVATQGPRRKVLIASGVLLAAVLAALANAIAFKGDARLAAVLPVIALSWLNRALQRFASARSD